MVGMLGIPPQLKQRVLLNSLAQLQLQSADRAARFQRLNAKEAKLPESQIVQTPQKDAAILETKASPTERNELFTTPKAKLVKTENISPQPTPQPTQVTPKLSSPPEVEKHAQETPAKPQEPSPAKSPQATSPQATSPQPETTPVDATPVGNAPQTPNSRLVTLSATPQGLPQSPLLATPERLPQPLEKSPVPQEVSRSPVPATPEPAPQSPAPQAPQESPVVVHVTPQKVQSPVKSPEPEKKTATPAKSGSRPSTPIQKRQGPFNPVASRQLWELLAGKTDVPDCAALLAAGADVECRNGDRGQTPLMQACFAGQREVAAMLIQAGANVNARDESPNQQNPLLYAIFAGKSNIVELLIKNGANPNEKDLHGYTALMYAVHYGKMEVAAYLIRDVGCDLWEKDPHGRSAFKLAFDNAQKDQGRALTFVSRALFERGRAALPSDPEQLALIHAAMPIIAHEQCRQLRLMLKVHHKSHGLPVIVIDNGAAFIRGGLVGKDKPSAVFPAVKGSLKGEMVRGFLTQGGPTSFLGDQALQKKQLLQLQWPLRKEWDLKFLEEAWEKVFNMCQVDPSECAVILTQSRALENQQKFQAMQELMFQRFSVQYVSVLHAAAAASVGVYGLQCPVHLSLHVGCTVATAMVWVDERPSFFQSNVGGIDCTDYLHKNSDWGLGESSAKVWDLVNSIKEGKAYCLPTKNAPPREEKESWLLSDGTSLPLGPELATAAEVLFAPDLMGKRAFGLPELVRTAIASAPAAVQATLWANIIISGGCTLFPGFDERLMNELKDLDRSQCGGNCPIRFVNPAGKGREELAWSGAANLFTPPSYFGCLVNQDEFEETAQLLNKARVDGCDSLTSMPILEAR